MAITFRNAASANANTVAITTPASKDVIIVFAFNNASTTIPTVPASYKSLGSNSTTACAGVAAIRISDGTETSVPAFTNATNIVALIYRSAFAEGAFASGVGNSNVITYPALTLKDGSGNSWVVAGAIEKAATAGMNGTASPLTSNRTNQTTVNGLDTNGGVASFGATNLTVTTSGRFVAFSVELLAQPLISETLTLSEAAKVQIRGGSFDYNLIDSVANDTVITGTAGSEQMSFVDMLRFVDANKAAFMREVDILTQTDAVVTIVGIAFTFSDQMTLSDADIVKELGGSFVYELLDPLGIITIATGTAGSESINSWQDPAFSESLEYAVALGCPHLGNLWNDTIDFVQTPSQAEISDYTPWSLNARPGNAIPFENFEFVLTPSLISVIEHSWGSLWQDAFAYNLTGGGLLTEVLADALTLTDALAIGYGQGQVDALTFSDSSLVGYGDVIADSLTQSDSEQNILGMNKLLSDQLVLTDAAAIGYGNSISEQIVFSDSNLLGYGDLFNEQIVLSDALTIGYGQANVDALTITDNVSVGYGDQITDLFTLTDAEVNALGINELLSDSLTLTDAIKVGYGNVVSDQLVLSDFTVLGVGNIFSDTITITDSTGIGYGALVSDQIVLADFMAALLSIAGTFSDQLVFSDSSLLGYGNLVSDQIVLTDASKLVFGLNEFVTETISITDSISAGYGFAIIDQLALSDSLASLFSIAETLSDTLTLSDATAIGYGQGSVDSLTFSDSSSIGYGAGISDAISLSDSLTNVFGFNELLSDQLVLTDAERNVLGVNELLSDAITFSDSISTGYGNSISDQLVLMDSTTIGYGQANVDTLTFSDASAIGFGALITDTLTLTDFAVEVLGIVELLVDTVTLSDNLQAGYGSAVTDQIVLSDSTAMGYGQGTVDALTFSDSSSIGYGDLISDSFALTDAYSQILSGQNELTEQLSDSLTQSDTILVGYGLALSETIAPQIDTFFYVWAKNPTLGGADRLSDGDNLVINLLDAEINVLGIVQLFSDTLTLTDSLTIGYGLLSNDTLTFSDTTAIGYGQGVVDALTFVDSNKVGFGDLIADSFALTDSETTILGILEAISDTIILSDATAIGYGQGNVDSITFSDSSSVGYGSAIRDSFTLTDSMTELLAAALMLADSLTFLDSLKAGYGNQFVEQLIITEGSAVGYGNLISDSLANWLDNFQFTTGLPSINLSFSDTISLQEQLQAGYGNALNDQNSMTDQAVFIEAMNLLLADATPAMLDAFATIINYGLVLDDQIVFDEQVRLLFALIAGGDQLNLSDQLDTNLVSVLALALADSNVGNWLDSVLSAMVFAPGEIIIRRITVTPQGVVSAIDAEPEGGVRRLTVEVEGSA